MTDTEIEAMVARVEAAAGPDRDIDWGIHCRDGLWGVGFFGDHPAYTGSIDAARTLVPEGWAWSLIYERERELSGKPAYFADARNGYRTSYSKAPCAYGATPALALTAAALRARSADNGRGPDADK